MTLADMSPVAIADELGNRLKQARLNANLTQAEVAFSHWMRLNGKRDNFTREDFYSFEKLSPIFTRRKIERVIEETTEHVSTWSDLAAEHGVPHSLLKLINSN